MWFFNDCPFFKQNLQHTIAKIGKEPFTLLKLCFSSVIVLQQTNDFDWEIWLFKWLQNGKQYAQKYTENCLHNEKHFIIVIWITTFGSFSKAFQQHFVVHQCQKMRRKIDQLASKGKLALNCVKMWFIHWHLMTKTSWMENKQLPEFWLPHQRPKVPPQDGIFHFGFKQTLQNPHAEKPFGLSNPLAKFALKYILLHELISTDVNSRSEWTGSVYPLLTYTDHLAFSSSSSQWPNGFGFGCLGSDFS